MRIAALLAVALAVVALAACGGPRAAGPSPSERGRIVMWTVPTTPQWSFSHCSDDSGVQSSASALAYTYSEYFAYKVSADGTTAADQDCGSTDPASCQASTTGVVFAIDGHTLTWAPAATQQSLSGETCKLQTTQKWTLVDQGTTLAGTMELDFALVDGDDCSSLEAEMESLSTNGYGFQGCAMIATLSGTFDSD